MAKYFIWIILLAHFNFVPSFAFLRPTGHWRETFMSPSSMLSTTNRFWKKMDGEKIAPLLDDANDILKKSVKSLPAPVLTLTGFLSLSGFVLLATKLAFSTFLPLMFLSVSAISVLTTGGIAALGFLAGATLVAVSFLGPFLALNAGMLGLTVGLFFVGTTVVGAIFDNDQEENTFQQKRLVGAPPGHEAAAAAAAPPIDVEFQDATNDENERLRLFDRRLQDQGIDVQARVSGDNECVTPTKIASSEFAVKTKRVTATPEEIRT